MGAEARGQLAPNELETVSHLRRGFHAARHGRIQASRSEPHLPSMLSNIPQESSSPVQSPFTSIPDGFFRRRTGIAWLSQSKSGSTSHGGDRSMQEHSFEVEHLGDIKAFDSGWLDDDVEEVMVVSKKEKKRRPLSVIVEASEAHARSPLKPILKNTSSVDATHFEYIQSLHVQDASESILARKFDSGNYYTVKIIRRSGHDAARWETCIRNEQTALKMLPESDGAYVTKLWWSFEDERAMYLVTDRTDGRNLRQVIEIEGPVTERTALLCIAELAAGISGLHKHGIVHANLRPENVLVGQDGHIIISDLGNALTLCSGKASKAPPQVVNSEDMVFQAPEQILGWDTDYAVDWWNFGLVMIWVYTGRHPLVTEDGFDHPSITRSKLLHARLRDDLPGMEENARQLVARCLQRNTVLRINGADVKSHSFFHGIDWNDVTAKRLEAPFTSIGSNLHTTLVENLSLRVPATCDSADGVFSFDYRDSPPPCDAAAYSSPELTEDNKQVEQYPQEPQAGDRTLMLDLESPLLPPEVGSGTDLPREPVVQRLVGSSPVENLDAVDTSILPEFGTTPDIGLPTPPNSRIGNLRKYSSLNFDDLDSFDSNPCSTPPAGDSTGRLGQSGSKAVLRKSKSILGLSLDTLRDADDSVSLGSGLWTNMLRKRHQGGTPVPQTPPVPAPPVVELPKGVHKMGSGIGYTYRGESRRPSLNLASLTPRTCHGIFSGRRSRSSTKSKAKEDGEKAGSRKDGQSSSPENRPSTDVERDGGNEEDLMDEVMREIYGGEWNAGLSPDPEVRGTSLGWGDVLTMSRFGMASDASFAGPDSTLRLVTSPSTPQSHS